MKWRQGHSCWEHSLIVSVRIYQARGSLVHIIFVTFLLLFNIYLEKYLNWKREQRQQSDILAEKLKIDPVTASTNWSDRKILMNLNFLICLDLLFWSITFKYAIFYHYFRYFYSIFFKFILLTIYFILNYYLFYIFILLFYFKYQSLLLQVRIGQMAGVLIAYHNASEIFGFEYIKREELVYIHI